jgi:hypothetical protein
MSYLKLLRWKEHVDWSSSQAEKWKSMYLENMNGSLQKRKNGMIARYKTCDKKAAMRDEYFTLSVGDFHVIQLDQ